MRAASHDATDSRLANTRLGHLHSQPAECNLLVSHGAAAEHRNAVSTLAGPVLAAVRAKTLSSTSSDGLDSTSSSDGDCDGVFSARRSSSDTETAADPQSSHQASAPTTVQEVLLTIHEAQQRSPSAPAPAPAPAPASANAATRVTRRAAPKRAAVADNATLRAHAAKRIRQTPSAGGRTARARHVVAAVLSDSPPGQAYPTSSPSTVRATADAPSDLAHLPASLLRRSSAHRRARSSTVRHQPRAAAAAAAATTSLPALAETAPRAPAPPTRSIPAAAIEVTDIVAPPAAEGMVDMAGSMFVPAGKVSNGHVVGRFPIGYTPFYPTVDLGTGKHAVMQVLSGAAKADFRLKELRLAQDLGSSNTDSASGVLSILNYVEHGESLLVFREPFIMDMHTHLRKSGRFDEDIAREYFAQMVKSLAQLHAHDVVMGPCMKLTSVVITSKDHLHVKFATLDGVHARGQPVGQSPTTTPDATVAYVAPELMKPGARSGERQGEAGRQGSYTRGSDMWSLGVMLYALTTGAFPFASASTDPDVALEEMCSNMRTGQWVHNAVQRYERESCLNCMLGLSAPACSLLKSLLHIDPARRPSAAQVLNHSWIRAASMLHPNLVACNYLIAPRESFSSSATEALLKTVQVRRAALDDQLVPHAP